MEIDIRCKLFQNVHFVLFGFNYVDEKRVRSKLVDGGGIDVGQYGPSCTHVIVDKLVYDDPVCVAARNDGKLLVTGLWVDHSYDAGFLTDNASVVYRPLRDLNGIPGAKRFIMCLTGYQRQDREDIMTMVGLMGAQFSKPLVAHKVTHLICYKFEGDKYEVARKLRTIKLVNHRWLQDCLREWMLLPECNYTMSGYDLELLEAEAKDSEEEIHDSITKHSRGKSTMSSSTMIFGLHSTSEVSRTSPVPKASNDPTNVDPTSTSKVLTNSSKFSNPGKLDTHDATGAPTCQEAGIFNNAQSSVPSDMHTIISESERQRVKNELMSTPSNTARSPQLCAASYSKKAPWKSPLPLYSAERLDKIDVPSKITVDEMKSNIGFDAPLEKMELVKDMAVSVNAQNPWRETNLVGTGDSNDRLPLKRSSDVTHDVSKPQKMNQDRKSSTMNSPSSEKILGLEMKRFSLGGYDFNDQRAENSKLNMSSTEASNSINKSFTRDFPFSKSAPSFTEEFADNSRNSPRTPFKISENDATPNEPDLPNSSYGTAGDVVGKFEETDKQQHGVLAASESAEGTKTEKIDRATNLNFSTVGNNALHTKRHRIKMFAKKSLGSRSKLGSANQKGSIPLNKASSLNGSFSPTYVNNEKCISSMQEASPQTVSSGVLKSVETKELVANAVTFNEYDAMDVGDETAAPEKEANFEQKLDTEIPDVVQPISDVHKVVKEMAPEVQSDNIKTGVLDDMIPSDIIKRMIEPGDLASIENIQLDELSLGGDEKLGDRYPSEKTMLGDSSTKLDCKKGKNAKAAKASRKTIEVKGKKKSRLLAAGPKTEVHLKPDDEPEKENKPCIVGDQTSDVVKQCLEKPAVKSKAKQRKTIKSSMELSSNSSVTDEKILREEKNEPVCFILSGHRPQRKEFQKVIRHLKGRICRDSHQWSYQATHFIATDPIRRTEKFFAAAASGRWILKPDYLTECSQAGRLLEEEPFEWYKNGLTEDGAINLEAPRKWRSLRERTGHGAFYGMRIIIYGECIAPPLETLKRAVKAGDGIILATSPPYTRLLNSGVDFAVVSPGIPRSDLWVQEFLNHEIPCVAADYLVEYVCKPGYPLEKHVLYNSHSLAEKSFSSLQKRAAEVIKDLPLDDCSDDDIACKECGSRDREDVMLICGSKDGSDGCGVGMHIDCCDPPLQDIPDDDWFCPECSVRRKSKNSPNKRKKVAPVKRK